MIPSERSPMQEILTTSMYEYDISNEFSNWMKYKHYPIVSWTQKTRFYGKLSQNFRTGYGKWWIPIKLFFISLNFWELYELSSQDPTSDTLYVDDDWVMIDIRQAGKYVSKYLYSSMFLFIHIYIYLISCNYFSALFFGIFEYFLLFSQTFCSLCL